MQANPALHTPAKKNCTFEVEGRPDGEGYINNKFILTQIFKLKQCYVWNYCDIRMVGFE